MPSPESTAIIVPIVALLVLGYPIYRNVIPYPTDGPAQWFPIVAGSWLLVDEDDSRSRSPRHPDTGVRG